MTQPQAPSNWPNYGVQAMGFAPGVVPRALSGSAMGTLTGGLVGGLLGRYVAAPVASWLDPRIDPERMKTVGMIGGAMAGASPGAYMMYKNYQRGGMNGWFGGPLAGYPGNPPQQPQQSPPGTEEAYDRAVSGQTSKYGQVMQLPDWMAMLASVNSREKRAFYDATPAGWDSEFERPSIPFGGAMQNLHTAVANGTMGVFDAANVAHVMRTAQAQQPSSAISPANIARAAIGYGVGHLAGRALGAVYNTAFGGKLTAKEQSNLARGAGIGNAVFGMMGGLLR